MNLIHPVKVPRTRTSKSAEQVRADLLAAAARLFASRGFSEVSIADVAGAAGVATGTFYRYFPSKDEVVVRLRCDVLDELLAVLATDAAPTASTPEGWWTAAEATIAATIGFWFEDLDRSRVVLRGGFTDDAALIEADIAAGMAEGLAVGQALGAVRSDVDAPLAAGFVMHGVFGLVYHAIVGGHSADPARLVAGVTALARHMLLPPP
jgi:AcrR family transcriptional regulator